MDKTEAHTEKFLRTQFEQVDYEPLGAGSPPDFAGNQRVAIEVRRLNQNREVGKRYKGLEHVEMRLERRMTNLLDSLSASEFRTSWVVSYSYRRPLPDWAKLRPRIVDALRGRKGAPCTANGVVEIDIHRNLRLLMKDSGRRLDRELEHGGYCDLDAGGWVQAELIRNIQICVDEKTSKIARVQDHYETWWLVLVDHVSLAIGPSFADLAFVASQVTVPNPWNRVVLISPSDSQVASVMLERN